MNMELKITNEKKSILPRKEVEAVVTYEDMTTPSRKELRQMIAKQAHGKEEFVVIKSIKPDYGKREAKFTAFLYDDEESMKKCEQAKMIAKNTGKKEEKAAAPAQ